MSSFANVHILDTFKGYFYRVAGWIVEGRTDDAYAHQSGALFYRKDLGRFRMTDDAGDGHTLATIDDIAAGTSFDFAEAGDLAAIGAAAAAGTSAELPRGDHVHALALDGSMVAPVADGNLTGGIPVVHKLVIADGATADVDFVLVEKLEILDVAVIKTAGAGQAGNSITLKTSGNTAITDAIATTGADKVVTRSGTIDDAANVIAAGGTLRVTRTRAGGDGSAVVLVRGVVRA